MSTLATVIGLAVLFGLGVIAGMISSAGAYAHLETRYRVCYDALERIVSGGDASQIAWEALEADHKVRLKGASRALD